MQGTTAVGLPNGNVRESLMGQSLLGLQAALPILLICWLVAASKVLVTWAVLMGCWGRIYILPVSWLVKNRWTQAAAAKSSGSSDPDGLTYIRPCPYPLTRGYKIPNINLAQTLTWILVIHPFYYFLGHNVIEGLTTI